MSSKSSVEGISDSLTKMDLSDAANKPSTASHPPDKPQDTTEEKMNSICEQLEAWEKGDERLNRFAR